MLQAEFVSRFNFYCLAAGLVAIWPWVVRAVSDGYLFQLDGLIILGGPVGTAFAYLVAMVIVRRRQKIADADSS